MHENQDWRFFSIFDETDLDPTVLDSDFEGYEKLLTLEFEKENFHYDYKA